MNPRTPWRAAVVAIVAVTIQLWISPVFAGEVQTQDGRDEGALVDIARLWHVTNDESITFGLETHEAFDNETEFYLAKWDLDTNEDARPGDACIFLEQDGGGGLVASLFGQCGPEVGATATAEKVSGTAVSFTFPLSALREAAALEPGAEVAYTVSVRDLEGHPDLAPDGGLLGADGVVDAQLSPTQKRALASDLATEDGSVRSGGYTSTEGSPARPRRQATAPGAGLPVSADARETGLGSPASVPASEGMSPIVLFMAAVVLTAVVALTIAVVSRRRALALSELHMNTIASPIHVPDTSRS